MLNLFSLVENNVVRPPGLFVAVPVNHAMKVPRRGRRKRCEIRVSQQPLESLAGACVAES